MMDAKAPASHGFSLLLARVRHGGARLGWPAALGALLAIGAAGVEWNNRETEGALLKLRATQSELQARLSARPDKGEDIQRLAGLSDAESLAPVVSALHGGARKNGVQLEQGEYRLQHEAGTQLSRYRISFPARGAYPQLYNWLAEAVAAQPGLMLDGLDLKRDNIGAEQLESKVRLSLLVKER